MIKFAFFLFFVQASSESAECQAEWQKVLASQNPATSAGEDYQRMAFYSGFTINNLGNFDSCNKISIARYVVLTYQRPLPIVQTLCGPIVCTKEDYVNSTFEFIVGVPIEVEFPHKYQEDYYTHYSASAVLMLIFVFSVVGISVVATIIDYLSAGENNDLVWLNILSCFSLIRNVKTLFTRRSQEKLGKADNLDVLDAARVMSAGWIVYVHTVIISLYDGIVSNYDTVLDEFTHPHFTAIITGTYATDSFFWISAFLMTFFFLRHLEKTDSFSILALIQHFLHRFLRLSPTNYFIYLFFMSMQRYIGNGPMFYRVAEKSEQDECKDHFYANALYLNNIIPDNKGNTCFTPTNTLALDMQFFIFFSLVVVVYSKLSKVFGWILIALACICGVVTSGVIAAHYDLQVGIFNMTEQYSTRYFNKPYTRISPYALGVGSGIIFYSYRQLQNSGFVYDSFANTIANSMNNVYIRYTTFFLGLALINTFIWAQYDVYAHPGPYYKYDEWTDSGNAAFIAFERFGFGLGVTCILGPLLLGHLTWVVAFMTFIPWSFFSRLSIHIYLIHTPLHFLFYLSQKTVYEFNIFNMIFYGIDIFLLSCLCGLPILLLIEYPMLNFDKIINPRSVLPEEYQKLASEDSEKDRSKDN
jgi:hypothetical protein